MYDLNDLLPAGSIEIGSAETHHELRLHRRRQRLRPGPAGARTGAGRRPTTSSTSAPRSARSFHIAGIDMNAAHQVTGQKDKRPFWYDGTTSSSIFTGRRSRRRARHQRERRGDRELPEPCARWEPGGLPLRRHRPLPRDPDGFDQQRAGSQRRGRHRRQHHGRSRPTPSSTTTGSMTPVLPPSGTGSELVAVNQLGVAVGYYYTTPQYNGTARAFVFDGTTSTDLGTLGGPVTSANAINDAGEIVGASSTATQANRRIPVRQRDDDEHRAAWIGHELREPTSMRTARSSAATRSRLATTRGFL